MDYKELCKVIDSLQFNDYNWEEIDYLKPVPVNFARAKVFLRNFMDAIEASPYTLTRPYIHNSEDGGVTFSWRGKEGTIKSLYFDIDNDSIEMTRIWKSGSQTICKSDKYSQDGDHVAAWEWYIGKD